MREDAVHDLKSLFESFSAIPFPELGYCVDDLPETDSELAGLVSQALGGQRLVVDRTPIVSGEMLAEVTRLCEQSKNTPECAELESYVAKMVELEAQLRQLWAID
jgi:hypothetical protein